MGAHTLLLLLLLLLLLWVWLMAIIIHLHADDNGPSMYLQNYPDSLEVGNCKRTKCIHGAESRAHFSLWCITSSPLYLGMKLQNITDDDLAIVSNKDGATGPS